MTLYELTDEFRQLTETWDDTITNDEFMIHMDNLNAEFESKIKNCAFYVKNMTGDISAIDVELKRLQTRKKTINNRIDGMKDYMQRNMIELQKPKIDFEIISVRLQNNPPRVNILNDELIPDEFKTEKTIVSLDKKAIKEAGGCKGAEIVQEQSLRIK